MKQYDKIWVPDSMGVSEVRGIGYIESCKKENNVIVLTIEELKEMWNTAMERRDRDVWMRDIGKDDYNTAPTFEEYLTEQGIQIP